ncbi:uncharacterized protein [Physcomitrium patens]|uniref:VOC domain-containing protein n=1 Tax=Physcomitrium patens TaxID=3218 RepID=A9T8B7_PHYPA|nr:uncharacterized protein LOC112290555 [Physcomitrium patens]PNR42198.1 hypothetical protein PHYPA_017027 [Physcomitrium patens]|eukprot:XP_024392701.1 uncharacterized protein LOC112290555 [Physcomitrella patens]
MTGIVYEQVMPHLVVKPHQVNDAIAFYQKAFGAEEVKRQTVKKQHPTGADKSVQHAHLRFGHAEVLLVEETEELGSSVHNASSLHGTPVILHINTSDVDAAFKQAVEAGAKVSEKVADQSWGQRYGKVIDPYGFVWSLATPIHGHSHTA